MIAVGETLRRERLRRNLDLRKISDELKLSMRFLEAIENEQFDRLPGAVFTRSWVRQYARLLGLDEEELAAAVGRLVEEPPPETFPSDAKQHSTFKVPLPSAAAWDTISDGVRRKWPAWLPGLALAVLVTLACSGVYVWWERAQHAAPHAARKAASEPQSVLAAPPGAPPAIAPAESAPLQAAGAGQPQDSASTSTAEAPKPAPAALQPSASMPAETGPSMNPAPSGAAAQAPGAGSVAPVHVEFTAREPVWVRASSDGTFRFAVTLAPNQTRTLDANDSVELRLGNAAGLDIKLNGKPIGAVGPEGQIRTVQLTSGGFNIVAPSKPAPASPPSDPL
jgi:cytoskeleton protein RodZ